MKIFLAYSRKDREAAQQIKNKLEAAGHSTWIDIEGIAGGQNWLRSIQNAIDDADWMIVLLSPDSVTSEWVRIETEAFLRLDKPILPIMVRQTTPFNEIAQYQYIDATLGLDRVISNIISLIPSGNVQKPIGPQPSTASREEVQKALESAPLLDRIFIAYARPQRSIAASLADMLHECGKSIFYDAHIRAGAQWRKIIQSALDDATHMIVLWTPEARDSDEVEREVSYALAQGITIIPLLSREIPKLPYHLHGLQYLILAEHIDTVKSDLLAAIDQRSKGESDIWH